MSEQPIIAAEPLPHVCPKHPHVALQCLLAGGAGWCSSCGLYTQSANHAEPLRDIPRPEKAQAKQKATKASKARRRTAQRKTATAPSGANPQSAKSLR